MWSCLSVEFTASWRKREPEGAVNSTDKQLHIYPDLFHEIFNEPEQEAVFADMARWCDRVLPT